MGDFGSGEDDQFTVAKLVETLIKKYDTKLILGLGDNFYPNGVTSIYDDKFLDQFELPYSNLPKAVKFYNVLGNHDYKGKIQPQIDYTQISKRWIMNSNWYYFNKTINKNTVRFYAIDTNLENLSEKMKLEQREGLIKSIKNSSAKWNILYGHHPYRSTGYHGNCSQELESFYNELINTGKIDIIISGHDHDQQEQRDDREPGGPEPDPQRGVAQGPARHVRPDLGEAAEEQRCGVVVRAGDLRSGNAPAAAALSLWRWARRSVQRGRHGAACRQRWLRRMRMRRRWRTSPAP